MSQEEREELLSEMLVIRRMLSRGLTVFGVAFLTLIYVVVGDHFDQKALQQNHAEMQSDMEAIGERVEKLWYRAYPEGVSLSLGWPF